MTRDQEARKLTKEAKQCYLQRERTSTRLAEIYQQVIDDELWNVQYENFEGWLEAVGDHKASQAYAMARTYRELKKTVPKVALDKMPFVNARDLTEVPEARRTADMIKDATELTNNQLRERLNIAVPGLSLEKRNYRGFQVEESAGVMLDKALKLAKEKYEVETDSGAIEIIAGQFLSAEAETPQYSSAKAVVETVEESINPDDAGAPPTGQGWYSVLVMVRRMARVFGFPERRVMAKAQPVPVATERVQ